MSEFSPFVDSLSNCGLMCTQICTNAFVAFSSFMRPLRSSQSCLHYVMVHTSYSFFTKTDFSVTRLCVPLMGKAHLNPTLPISSL